MAKDDNSGLRDIFSYITWGYAGHKIATISEVLKAALEEETDDARVQFLREWANANKMSRIKIYGMRNVLQCLFHPGVKFDLPEGMPETFRVPHPHPDKVGNSLFKIAQNFGYFINGSKTKISNNVRRETLFVQFCESMCSSDAAVMIACKTKNLDIIPGLTQELASRAFPQWVDAPVKFADQGVSGETKKAPAKRKPAKKATKRPAKKAATKSS